MLYGHLNTIVVGTFSGKCETSRRFVDSSSGDTHLRDMRRVQWTELQFSFPPKCYNRRPAPAGNIGWIVSGGGWRWVGHDYFHYNMLGDILIYYSG